jgi:hypothetical protein
VTFEIVMLKTLILVLVFIAFLWLIFKIVKSLIKVAIIGIVVVIISMAAFGIFVYKDMKNIQDLTDKPKLCLLEDKGEIMLAAVIEGMNESSAIQIPTPDEYATIKTYYGQNKMKDLQGSYYKVFVFKRSFFEEGLPETVSMPESMEGLQTLSKQEMLTILSSDQPVELVVDKLVATESELNGLPADDAKNLAREKLMNDTTSVESLKAEIFFVALQNVIETRGLSFVLEQYRADNLAVYPKTILFTVVQDAPDFIVNPLIKSSPA